MSGFAWFGCGNLKVYTMYVRHFSRVLLSAATLIGGLTLPAPAGVLVLRGDHGIQFAEAVSLTVNGKDKVLSLGAEPKIAGPVGKLPEKKLGTTMLTDIAGIPAFFSDGSFQYVLPEGLPKNGVPAPTAAWKSARLSFKKSSSDKAPQEFAADALVAFLPQGVEELASLCSNDAALGHIAGPAKAFSMRMELMAAAVKTYGSDPALAPLERQIAAAMRSRFEEFESGLGGADLLSQTLRLVELSGAVYPGHREQQSLREQITERKAWIDRRLAILHALASASEWDALLLGDGPFEKYETAFPEMAALHASGLKASLQAHRQAGEDLLKEREFEAALREFRLAAARQPSDKLLQQKVSIAWANYSREIAVENKRNRKQLGAGEREILDQAVQFATNYKNENKLDLAFRSVSDAEGVDPDSLPMLLKKAEILGAQRDFSKALATLDHYDLHAVDEERDAASRLRNDLLFRRTSSLEETRAQIQKAWAAGSYHAIYDMASKGLQARDDEADLLYNAGVASQITRNSNRSRDYFVRYLQVSDTLDANAEQRAAVRRMLASLRPAADTATGGEPNWLSGKKLAPDTYYCPVSLAFQPRIERIEASNKLKVAYEWSGDRLTSITPQFEKPEHATGERRITFAYDDRFPQVAVASDGDTPAQKRTTADPDELVRSSSLVILNNPYIDPDAVQKLTGRNVTLGISGNRFFQPFVWDKIHYFRFTYDTAGRVAQAVEIANPGGSPTGLTLRFEWNGLQLTAVRGYSGPDERRLAQIYERTIEYQGGRLVAEEIRSEGKSSHIKYNYNGGRLVSAACSNDPSLDDRSRQVMFR